MKKDIRDIFGEYDPPYTFNSNPTKEQKRKAEILIDKYKKLLAEKESMKKE